MLRGHFLQPLTMQFRKSFRYAKHRFIIVRITVKDDGVSKYSGWILQPFGEDALCLIPQQFYDVIASFLTRFLLYRTKTIKF